MLTLDKKMLIAKGDDRKCYFHPNDENLCVKILHQDMDIRIHHREIKYYNHLIKKNISWDMLARFNGVVQTNLGQGMVFELIRDVDGSVSKTLDYYLRLDQDTMNSKILVLIDELQRYILEQGIIIRDLITRNLLMKKTGDQTYQLVIVVGIGYSEHIPFCLYFKKAEQSKIKRIWNRKMDKWFREYESIRDKIKPYQ